MKHRNLKDERWTRMAIDSLFDRGGYDDWQEFAEALRGDRQLAIDALYMSEHHAEKGSAELARVLVGRFYGEMNHENAVTGLPARRGNTLEKYRGIGNEGIAPGLEEINKHIRDLRGFDPDDPSVE